MASGAGEPRTRARCAAGAGASGARAAAASVGGLAASDGGDRDARSDEACHRRVLRGLSVEQSRAGRVVDRAPSLGAAGIVGAQVRQESAEAVPWRASRRRSVAATPEPGAKRSGPVSGPSSCGKPSRGRDRPFRSRSGSPS